MHGGTVTAESPGPGRGSIFTVRLPALGSLPQRAVKPLHTASSSGEDCRRRILVVDDNQDSATSMAMMLRRSATKFELRMTASKPSRRPRRFVPV